MSLRNIESYTFDVWVYIYTHTHTHTHMHKEMGFVQPIWSCKMHACVIYVTDTHGRHFFLCIFVFMDCVNDDVLPLIH